MYEEMFRLPPRIMRLPPLFGKSITDVLRLDELHPVISGNKWYKLKYSLEQVKAEGYTGLTTFGGAFSNHIAATACACALANIPCRGIIRGEAGETLTPTLQTAMDHGMEIEFISRGDYKALRETGFSSFNGNGHLVVPEGGANAAGVRGASEILDAVHTEDYTHIFCAIGTGTTAAGLLQRMNDRQKLICINVLKGGSFQEKDIIHLSGTAGNNLSTRIDFHFGGYAKHTPELVRFMNRFYEETGIPTDIVYTAKLFYAWHEMAHNELNDEHVRILVVHSGGLQGNSSLSKGTLIF